MIEPEHSQISIMRQCDLLDLPRSSYYYQPVGESAENLHLMRLLDEQYTRALFYGIKRMTAWLHTQGYEVNHKRVAQLMRTMGLEAIYPKPRLSQAGANQHLYPYLLRGVKIERVNHVWSTDITYIRLAQGFVYLVAIMDWFSRSVLSWQVSITEEVYLKDYQTVPEAVRNCGTISPFIISNGCIRPLGIEPRQPSMPVNERRDGDRQGILY